MTSYSSHQSKTIKLERKVPESAQSQSVVPIATISIEEITSFCFPPGVLHPQSTARLFIIAENGPLIREHSYLSCLCKTCQIQVRDNRKLNPELKEIFHGKHYSSEDLDISLKFLCAPCAKHAREAVHIKGGYKGAAIVSDKQIDEMARHMEREDVLTAYERKGKLGYADQIGFIANVRSGTSHSVFRNLSPKEVEQMLRHVPKVGGGGVAAASLSSSSSSSSSSQQDVIVSSSSTASSSATSSVSTAAGAASAPRPSSALSSSSSSSSSLAAAAAGQSQSLTATTGLIKPTARLDFHLVRKAIRDLRKDRVKQLQQMYPDLVPAPPPARDQPQASLTRALLGRKIPDHQTFTLTTRLLNRFAYSLAEPAELSRPELTSNIYLMRYFKADGEMNWKP